MILAQKQTCRLFSVADQMLNKTNRYGKGLFRFLGLNPSPHQGKQSRSSRQELKQRPWKNPAYCIWLAKLCPCTEPARSQVHWPKDVTAHSGQGRLTSTSSTNQENGRKRCSWARLMEAILQWRVPAPQCVNLTTKTGRHNKAVECRIQR